MRFRPAGGLDLASGALILGGASLIAASLVAAAVLMAPPQPSASRTDLVTTSPTVMGRASASLQPDRVATVLTVDTGIGAGGTTRTGDHVDVLGYFSRQVTGADAVTRVLLQDVSVLAVERGGANVSLTLAVPQQSALLLQEAQALGARPFVTLRPVRATAEMPASFSDSDLAGRLSGAH
jgi:Flp pilus assembly protein RcpC/CpaB